MNRIVFELSPEQRRVEHLIAFSNTLTDEPWSYDGDVVAVKNKNSVTVHGLGSWANHRGECILDADAHFGHHLMSNGAYGKFIPDDEYVSLAGADGSWGSEKAHVSSSHSRNGGDLVSLRLYDLNTGQLNKETPSTGLIIAGADLDNWPMFFPKDSDGKRAVADGFVSIVFGRDALIRRMPTKTDAGHDVLVAFDGGQLEPLQQAALWVLLSFLAGRRANFVGSIGIDCDREVWRKRSIWKAPLHASRPPLGPMRSFDLCARFPEMLNNAHELLQEDIPIDVSLEHLFADSRGHLDIEIRDVALALDALVEANAFNAKDATVVEPDEYSALLPSMKTAIDDTLMNHVKREALVARITERLKGANDVSHGQRRRNFWRRVGFDLKPDEKDSLDNRHPMSHAGHILRKADSEEYEALLNQVKLARNLVNRVILALLGYDGPVFDYTNGSTETWQYYLDRDGSRKKTR